MVRLPSRSGGIDIPRDRPGLVVLSATSRTWDWGPKHDDNGTAIGLPVSWGGASGGQLIGIYSMAYMECLGYESDW